MRKTCRLYVAALVVLSVARLAAAAGESANRPLNVLFIATDDLRNDLGCYGNTEAKTPNFDRLARRSLVFDRAYCQQAVCNPSRASLLTGRRPDTLRIWDLPTHFRQVTTGVTTLPEHFMRNGYFTQNVGKVFHNGRQTIEGDPESWSVPAVMHFARHGEDVSQVTGELPRDLADDPRCECRDVPDEAYFDGRVAKLAVAALEERSAAEVPFFLAVGFWKPHAPFNAPKRYWDMYERETVSLPLHPEWPEGAPRVAWHDSQEMLGSQSRTLTPDAIREIRHGYLANISYLDTQLGKVLDAVDRLNLWDDTVVVLWADHGYHLGEQSLWAKTSNFELDARVPLLIATPGMATAGRHTSALAELLDLYPTLVDVCSLPKVEGLEGKSLAPILADPNESVREAALTQHPRPAYYDREADHAPTSMGYSVRTDRFRYTQWRDWRTGMVVASELYDHESDPDETRNAVDEPSRAADVVRCQQLLESFQPIVRAGWKPVLP